MCEHYNNITIVILMGMIVMMMVVTFLSADSAACNMIACA